jgi:quinol monooxygenase YgiN
VIHVVAIIKAVPGKRDEVLKEFRAVLPEVLAEEGCIEYGPAIDSAASPDALGPDTFAVIEKWATPEALKAHATSSHMAAYGQRVKDLLASRAIHVLEAC